MIKKPCCSRFSLHKFVQLKFFLDPIQKSAPARSVQLEAVYPEALLALWPLQLSQTVAGLICTLIKFSAWSAKLKVTDRWHLFRDLICMILFWHTSNISYWKSMPFQDPSDELHTRDKKCNMSYHYNIAYFLNFMVMFLFCMWKWYFVTKIVLTYCEKKLF